jgi:hypothetical protein
MSPLRLVVSAILLPLILCASYADDTLLSVGKNGITVKESRGGDIPPGGTFGGDLRAATSQRKSYRLGDTTRVYFQSTRSRRIVSPDSLFAGQSIHVEQMSKSGARAEVIVIFGKPYSRADALKSWPTKEDRQALLQASDRNDRLNFYRGQIVKVSQTDKTLTLRGAAGGIYPLDIDGATVLLDGKPADITLIAAKQEAIVLLGANRTILRLELFVKQKPPSVAHLLASIEQLQSKIENRK